MINTLKFRYIILINVIAFSLLVGAIYLALTQTIGFTDQEIINFINESIKNVYERITGITTRR